MESVDFLVIGAGVVGLATAARLARPGRQIVLAERNDSFGRETSSRNSEVIHCGMYYAEQLLKTRLCVRGNPLLHELCARQGIPHRKTGKILSAADESEAAKLHDILAQGRRNSVPGLRLMSTKEMQDLEPLVSGVLGLYSPESGIVDSHSLMAWFESQARDKRVTIAYGCEVRGARKTADGYVVGIRDSDGTSFELSAACVINSAGLRSDWIASLAGIDVEKAGYSLRLCKGEYFRVADRHRGKLRHLVYPVPSPVHLGAHAVVSLDGGLKIGPNSFYVDSVDYNVDPAHRADFHEKAARILPFIELDDLRPDISGIRPKLYRSGEPVRD
ncbi:MAG TPA: NAD(P)/FAD-dependent oxidoreductase, partial [Spirochaetia bacterium]|nr:NAD(P)/FAD-dependent oxidoreductase [Spirochaetia bacterium]